MSDSAYRLADYVADLRRISSEETDDRKIVQRVSPLAKKFAASPDLVKPEHYEVDPDQGFTLNLLHEEDDHANAVFLFAWAPNRGTPAHNHKTWGVVVGIEGEELETWWRRLDDGSKPGFADLKQESQNKVGPGTVSCVLPEDLHTVQNNMDCVTLSLHTYGKHINYTGRSSFDPAAKAELPYDLKIR